MVARWETKDFRKCFDMRFFPHFDVDNYLQNIILGFAYNTLYNLGMWVD